MRKQYFLCLIAVLLFVKLQAQYEVRGAIKTLESQDPLPYATIQLLDVKSSKTISFTTADTNGIFNLQTEKTGTYRFKTSYMGCLSFLDTIVIEKPVVFKNVFLKKDVEALEEVVLKYEPKVMKIENDTITYNLEKLTTGEERTLANIIEKLPGVKLNNSGQLIANGKLVKKLLIDGEELFKNQHRTTTESITAKMVEGVRYLDKYQDFGNIKGFDNKQTNALDVSIKEEYKNKITGDFKAEGGHESKYLTKTNLYRFGGQFKFGFIGNWNNLGKQSITNLEYDELRGIGFDEIDKNGFKIDKTEDSSPKFLEPTLDIEERINLFGALSLIYKPSSKTKISFLNVISNSKQKQFLLNNRRFFDLLAANQIEQRNVQSDFLLNTSVFEFGYQPSSTSFFEYIVNFNPHSSNEDFIITNTTATAVTSINQSQYNQQYVLDQKLSYLTKISSKTLLKATGLLVLDATIDDLEIISSTPAFLLEDASLLEQKGSKKRNFYGYQLKTISKFKKEMLRVEHGTIFTDTDFENIVANQPEFTNSFGSSRIDSYLNASYEGKLSKRLIYTGGLGYKFVQLERFGESFDNSFLLPSLKIDYRMSTSKNLSFDYSYNIALPVDTQLHPNSIIDNYFSIKSPSQVKSNQLLPSHLFGLYYSNFKIKTGTTFSTYTNYNYTPTFISFNNTITEEGIVTSSNIIGEAQWQWNFGLSFDKRFKSKLGIFSNFSWFYSEEPNSIRGEQNQATTLVLKNRGGLYSRYRKGVNFNLGLDCELTEYKASLLKINTKAIAIKPYLFFNGNLLEKKVLWSIGGEYANYKTDLDETNVINIYPKVTYEINDNFEISIEGNNILNIDNAEITRNFNTINYSESSVVDTLEGYIVFGLYYRL